jgi:hypothetical protein
LRCHGHYSGRDTSYDQYDLVADVSHVFLRSLSELIERDSKRLVQKEKSTGFPTSTCFWETRVEAQCALLEDSDYQDLSSKEMVLIPAI